MRFRSALAFISLSTLALFSFAPAALAQTANCTGVAAWNAATVYNPGDKMVYQNRLYQANIPIWNAAPTYCASCGWYTDLGACGTVGGDTTAPSVPANLASPSKTSTSITLSWSASTDNVGGSGVAGYDVYRGTSLVGSPTATSYTDSGLTPATSYTYRVRARDVATNASAQSAAITVSTNSAGTCTTVPSVPAGLNSPSQATNSISLAWGSVAAGANCTIKYRVFRGGVQQGEVTTNSFTNSGLNPDTAYSFTVAAVSEAGASAQSAAISARTRPIIVGGNKNVVGYFVQWGIYGRNYRVKNIDTSNSAAKLTHINYAFGNVRNNRCEVGLTIPSNEATGAGGDAFADYSKAFSAAESVDNVADTWDQPLRGSWGQLKKLKAKYPNIKVLISLGGWTWSRGFASAARPENRQAFVASCVDAYIRGNLPVTDNAGGPGAAAGVFDGIDIDWEYPAACGLSCGTAEEGANFTALLAEFRRQLDAVRPGLLLTIAAGAGVDKVRVTDPGTYHQYLNFINVMTYDFHGPWDPQTNHHTPLYATPADPSTGDQRLYNTHDALQAFRSRGVPASKLNLGIGFYGKGWTNVSSANNGLYQSGSAAAGTYEAGTEDYKVIKTKSGSHFTDATARAHWLLSGNTFWSYDDPALVFEKMQYVKNQGLGGAFFWEFSGDDAQGSMAQAVKDGLQ
jgi:chitinase